MGKPHETRNFGPRGNHCLVGQPTNQLGREGANLERVQFSKSLWGWRQNVLMRVLSLAGLSLTLILFLFLVELGHVEGFVDILKESDD